MGFDYILVVLSSTILLFYLWIFLLLVKINNMVYGRVRRTFVLFLIAVVLLIFRRLEYLLSSSEIFAIPYFRDSMSLIFSLLFLIAVYNFYKCVEPIRENVLRKPYHASHKKHSRHKSRKSGRRNLKERFSLFDALKKT